MSWLAVPSVFLALIYCMTNKSLKKELFWIWNSHRPLSKRFERKKPFKMTLHLWHLLKFLLNMLNTQRGSYLSLSWHTATCSVYVLHDLRVPAGRVAPGSSFCTKTRRQDVQMCMFTLQCLCVFLPYSITQSYRTAITCRHPDLGWIGKYPQFPLDNSLSKHTK